MLFKNEVFISPSPVGLPKLSLTGLQSQTLWGLVFLVQDPWAKERDMGLSSLTPVGEPLQCNYSLVCGSPIWGCMVLDYITSLPLLPILLWFVLCL